MGEPTQQIQNTKTQHVSQCHALTHLYTGQNKLAIGPDYDLFVHHDNVMYGIVEVAFKRPA